MLQEAEWASMNFVKHGKTIPRQRPPATASGLGRESAVRLAKAGATVVLTTRSEAKGKKAVEEVNLGLQHCTCHIIYPM